MASKILLLGDNLLYQRCEDVQPDELKSLRMTIEQLYRAVVEFKGKNGWGDAICAPQIGFGKRIICMNLSEPTIIINPVLEVSPDDEIEVVENCISIPGLWVRVRRHQKCVLHYRNASWMRREVILEDKLAYMIQHMEDHLNGVMITMRAVDDKSFYSVYPGQPWQNEKKL